MQMKSFTYKASDGIELAINRWIPDDEENIKGVIQLHHGLAEHTMRYDRFGSILAENGYVLNAYDMRGHGKTAEIALANKTGMFGKLADKDGFFRAVEDLNEVIESLKNDFPGKKVVLFGHSFGSFVSQCYIEKYGNKIDGCTLCGTAGPRGALIGFGKIAAKIVTLFCGANTYGKLLDTIAFGAYNKRVENPETKNDWLSKDKFVVQMYNDDNWCGFPLTNSFYVDMMSGLSYIHKAENMKKIPVTLPINLIFGEMDPVGDYGKTPKALYEIYQRNGIENVDCKEYKTDRHELLNETDKETVESDFISWLSKTLTD